MPDDNDRSDHHHHPYDNDRPTLYHHHGASTPDHRHIDYGVAIHDDDALTAAGWGSTSGRRIDGD